MATTLQPTKLSASLTSIVNNTIAAVKSVRASEQARKESEFQKAVAAGMTYQAQTDFRKKQLEDAKASPFNDEDYISQLELAVASTQKLARFETIRNKYKDALDNYVNGKESVSQQIEILNGLLETEKDPTLVGEIRNQLSDARRNQAKIEVDAIKNRALVAEKDTSQKLLDTSIGEIQNKRSLAAINENDDEVAMWDATLLALKTSKARLQIQNGLNEIVFRTNQGGMKANDKLGVLNGYVSGADASTPITYDGITYPSLKSYWENKRGEYISNGYLDEVKSEMDKQTAALASSNAFGQVPVPRIEAVNRFYADLASRPDFAPYRDKIEQERISSITGLANNLYTSLVDEANATGDFTKAEQAILGVENRLGVKIARPAFNTEVAAKKTIANQVNKDVVAPAMPTSPTPAPVVTTPQPTQQQPSTPAAPMTPAPQPTTPAPAQAPSPQAITPVPQTTAPKVVVVKPGETLSAIALRELGDASRAFELKNDTGGSYDEQTARKLQVGTKLVIPTK